jgi:hypothetical protein
MRIDVNSGPLSAPSRAITGNKEMVSRQVQFAAMPAIPRVAKIA